MITDPDVCGERTFPSASPIAHYSVGVENGISKYVHVLFLGAEATAFLGV